MSKTSGDFDVKKTYQIPSTGFIDTARILIESGYNSAEELEDDEDIFSDAQCSIIKPIQLEIDPDSDETELEKHDEGTLDPRVAEEYSINILSDTLGEDSKKAEVDRNPQRIKNYGNRHHRKGKLGHKIMLYISCFLISFGKMTLGAENKTYVRTNNIHKENIKPLHHNRFEEQRLDKRHIDDGTFKAFMCNEEADVSTAEFSLNDPPRCSREDGSAYYPPMEKKAQILQKIRRIPVEVTVCQVDWRINVGWCGGEYTALNYMHSDIETKRTKIQPNNVQCRMTPWS